MPLFLSKRALICLLSALVLTSAALASPRFTVNNDTDDTLTVQIFSGDDTLCSFDEKHKTLVAGKSGDFGCTGDGKGQCKIRLYADQKHICKGDENTCSKNAIKIPGKSEISVSYTEADGYDCTLVED